MEIFRRSLYPKRERSKENQSIQMHFSIKYRGENIFNIFNRRLEVFLRNNNYIDTLVQNGGYPGIPGAHRSRLAVIERSKNKGVLAILWLDLKNAYVSISP